MFVIYYVKEKGLNFNFTYIRFCILYGLPLGFHALSANILNQLDRIMNQKLGINMPTIGVYSLFCSYSSIMSPFIICF